METAIVSIVITSAGTGREPACVDYAPVALPPVIQSPDIEAWLAGHGPRSPPHAWPRVLGAPRIHGRTRCRPMKGERRL